MALAPNRRWPQFSLWSILVAITQIAISTWAIIEMRKAREFKVDAERLQKEKVLLEIQNKRLKLEAIEDFMENQKKQLRERNRTPSI